MLKFIILLLINITLASKTFILSIDLPSNCTYTTLNSIPEFCTYNYNIIKNYNAICNARVIIPNIGCSIDNKNRYVIYNLYIVKNNITVLSDTYNNIYTNIRYINILSDIKITKKAKTYLNGLNIRLYDNITLSYITIDRVRFLEVDYYIEVYGTMSPTLLPTLLPSITLSQEPSENPSDLPTLIPTAKPTGTFYFNMACYQLGYIIGNNKNMNCYYEQFGVYTITYISLINNTIPNKMIFNLSNTYDDTLMAGVYYLDIYCDSNYYYRCSINNIFKLSNNGNLYGYGFINFKPYDLGDYLQMDLSFISNIDNTFSPTYSTTQPTELPTQLPAQDPTELPTQLPSQYPTELPTQEPTSPTPEPTAEPTPYPTVEPTQDPTLPQFNLVISQNNHPFTNDVAQVSINSIQLPYNISITDFQETLTTIIITLSGFGYPYDKLNGNWVIYTTFSACGTNKINALSNPTDIYWGGVNSYYLFLTQDYCGDGPISLIYLYGLSIA